MTYGEPAAINAIKYPMMDPIVVPAHSRYRNLFLFFIVNAKAGGFEGGALASASLDAQHDGKRSPEAEGEDGLQAGNEHQQAGHRYDEGQLHRACHTRTK